MQRYALFRGVAGKLVPHPVSGSTPPGSEADGGHGRSFRYAGMRRLSQAEILDRYGVDVALPGEPGKTRKRMPRLGEIELPDQFEPVDEVLPITDRTLAKAVRSGALEQISKITEARSLQEAKAKLEGKPALTTSKRSVSKSKSTASAGGES